MSTKCLLYQKLLNLRKNAIFRTEYEKVPKLTRTKSSQIRLFCVLVNFGTFSYSVLKIIFLRKFNNF